MGWDSGIGERIEKSVHATSKDPGELVASLKPGQKWRRPPSCTDCHPSGTVDPAVSPHEEPLLQCRLCSRACVLAPGERYSETTVYRFGVK